MPSREITQVGLDLIKSFEGCQLTAYNATGKEQYLTIGWGHYGSDVVPGMVITQEQADAMLLQDMARYVAYVNDPDFVTITDELNQNQFDALVSFCYNCGAGNLQDLCKGRSATDIAEDLPKYNKGGGVVLAGLVRRRAAELELFNKDTITKGEDDEMDKVLDYPDWAWEQLEDYVGSAYNDNIIDSYDWVQQIKDKTLTYKDLLLLKILIDERRRTK